MKSKIWTNAILVMINVIATHTVTILHIHINANVMKVSTEMERTAKILTNAQVRTIVTVEPSAPIPLVRTTVLVLSKMENTLLEMELIVKKSVHRISAQRMRFVLVTTLVVGTVIVLRDMKS
jgi:hypothetical protein